MSGVRFVSEAEIEAGVTRVYRVYRDAFDSVAVDVENIERVSTVTRTPHPRGVVTQQLWCARARIPVVARRLIAPHMLAWDAAVTWIDADLRCHWRIATHHFRDCVDCAGDVRFLASGEGRARVVMRGRLVITLDSVRALPRIVQAPVARRSEKLLSSFVPRNFAAVAARVEAYIATHIRD